MSVFMTIIASCLAFMLYALIQFARESRRTISTRRENGHLKIQGTQSGRLVAMSSKRSRESSRLRDVHRPIGLR